MLEVHLPRDTPGGRRSRPPLAAVEPPPGTLVFSAASAGAWLVALGADRCAHWGRPGPIRLRMQSEGEQVQLGGPCLERSIACRPFDLAAGAVTVALWLREQAQRRSGQLLTCLLTLHDGDQADQSGLLVALRLQLREVWILGIGLPTGNGGGSVRLFNLPGEAKLLELEHGLDLRLLLGRSLGESLFGPTEEAVEVPPPVPEIDQERRRSPSD